jgi:histone acetyltransferase (RNA polymerase elongator complex component)
MDATVLRLSGRGHTKEQTQEAAALIKESGIKLGLQVMPGLPGETFESIVATATEVAALAPDFVRVYPTLVLKSTPLETLYLKGEYSAWPIADMVRAVAEVAEIFERADIPIVRMGLAPGKELEAVLVAGPYHPAFKDLVDTERNKNRQACKQA